MSSFESILDEKISKFKEGVSDKKSAKTLSFTTEVPLLIQAIYSFLRNINEMNVDIIKQEEEGVLSGALNRVETTIREVTMSSLAAICLLDKEKTPSKVIDDLHDLLLKKKHDYGDTYKHSGVVGLFIRLFDKAARLMNLSEQQAEPLLEPLEDTLYDIIGYCFLLRVYIHEKGLIPSPEEKS